MESRNPATFKPLHKHKYAPLMLEHHKSGTKKFILPSWHKCAKTSRQALELFHTSVSHLPFRIPCYEGASSCALRYV
jgi:hypothetical protein